MRFEVRAVGRDGVVSLALEAVNPADASGQAVAQGYTVLSVRRRMVPAARRRRFPLLQFSQELLALLNAGLGLVESLQTLREKHEGEQARKVLDRVLARVYEGRPLSDALAESPDAFPRLYVETVRAAERTGGVPEALARFVAYQERIDLVKSRILSASIYPVLLIVLGVGVALFLLGYVVPKFSAIYNDAGRELPFLSALLLRFGRVMAEHGWLLAGAGVASLVAVAALLSGASVRARLARMLWNLPGVGPRLRVYQLARFYRAMGMLLRGGIAFPRAADMVGALLQESTREGLVRAVAEVREGQGISAALNRHGLATPVALRMLAVAERGGGMGEMLERIAAFYDDELTRWVDWFIRLFEPLLMIVIGLVIGAIVLLLYMPIFELAGSLQ